MEKQAPFREMLLKAIWTSLDEIFGQTSAKAVAFYVDPKIAISNATLFSESLRKIFREGSKVLEEKCAEKLYNGLGIQFQKKEDWNLVDYIADAERKFSAAKQ
ncbi:MAG: hypothetical protein HYY68_09370 [Thaumarchaeota archaeon]|nr:hypothetical protein [Nitrososphaerota archaeon]